MKYSGGARNEERGTTGATGTTGTEGTKGTKGTERKGGKEIKTTRASDGWAGNKK